MASLIECIEVVKDVSAGVIIVIIVIGRAAQDDGGGRQAAVTEAGVDAGEARIGG